jgi:hypothetical protein
MRLLSVRPTKQWEDESTHHHKLGVHRYEDINQELDPAFHTLSEVERKEAERISTKEWRSGSEVKFQLGEKRPITRDFRFWVFILQKNDGSVFVCSESIYLKYAH